jgi:hypothetical protein
MWRQIESEGGRWEVRSIADAGDPNEEILEFTPVTGAHQPRRTVVPRGALDGMDEVALIAAFQRSRPIGGDYFGRPGKRMPDASA